MQIRKTLLALAIACTMVGAAHAQMAPKNTGSPLTESDVRAIMGQQGYTKINDVHFKEGVWTADARSADGNHVEVKVDASGKIIPDQHVATISKDQIIVLAQRAGYHNVHGVEFEGGVWKVEANTADNTDVELKMDPDDGHILGSSADKVQNHNDTADDDAERAKRDDTADDDAERAKRDDQTEEHH